MSKGNSKLRNLSILFFIVDIILYSNDFDICLFPNSHSNSVLDSNDGLNGLLFINGWENTQQYVYKAIY